MIDVAPDNSYGERMERRPASVFGTSATRWGPRLPACMFVFLVTVAAGAWSADAPFLSSAAGSAEVSSAPPDMPGPGEPGLFGT